MSGKNKKKDKSKNNNLTSDTQKSNDNIENAIEIAKLVLLPINNTSDFDYVNRFIIFKHFFRILNYFQPLLKQL